MHVGLYVSRFRRRPSAALRLSSRKTQMMFQRRFAAAVIAAASCAAVTVAQTTVVEFPDANLAAGATNTQPFGTTTAFTQFIVYPGLTTPTFTTSLQSAGVLPTQSLAELAVDPAAAGSGTYSTPQAYVYIGHLLNNPSLPNQWIANLDNPTLLWDSTTDGAFTFPWTSATWTPLPMRPNAQFFWDGVRDVGILITVQVGATGSFTVRTPSTGIYPRHGTTSFNAAPGVAQTTTAFLGMRMRMTWAPSFSQTATTGGGGVGDLFLGLTNIPVGTLEGYTFVTTDLTGSLGSGPFFGVWPDTISWSILFSGPATAGNPLHWLAGYPGLYPDVPFLVAPGSLSFLAGTPWRFVTVAFGFGPTYLGRTNVSQLNW